MKSIYKVLLIMGLAQGAWADEKSVVEKVTGAVKKGAEAAGHGIETGAKAAERGLKKGGEAAAKGVGKAGEWVGEKMEKGGQKLQQAADKSEPDESSEKTAPPQKAGE